MNENQNMVYKTFAQDIQKLSANYKDDKIETMHQTIENLS